MPDHERPAVPLLTITREDAAGNPAAGLAFSIAPLIGDVDGNLTASGFAFTDDAIIGGDPVEGVLDGNGEAVVNLVASADTNDSTSGHMRYRLSFAPGKFVEFSMPDADVRLEDIDL